MKIIIISLYRSKMQDIDTHCGRTIDVTQLASDARCKWECVTRCAPL